MLAQSEVMAFVATAQPERAKAFYRDVLGFKLLEDAWWALIFEMNGCHLHIEKLQDKLTPQPFTVLGWRVSNLEELVDKLLTKGVVFERPPGLQVDDKGIWSPPDSGGAKVCWFRDPDGNTLSMTQFPPG
jgi:catechol 2,3-dioxygenase-like lactoylglutathione lyase family enzyme